MKRLSIALGMLVLTLFPCLAQNVKTIQTSEYAYEVHAFFSGAIVKHLSIYTSDGQLLSTMEIPLGIFLSIYADSSDPGLKTSEDLVRRSSAETTKYSGRVSIRTQLAKNIKAGLGADESMMEVPLRLDLQNAVVTVTQPK